MHPMGVYSGVGGSFGGCWRIYGHLAPVTGRDLFFAPLSSARGGLLSTSHYLPIFIPSGRASSLNLGKINPWRLF